MPADRGKVPESAIVDLPEAVKSESTGKDKER